MFYWYCYVPCCMLKSSTTHYWTTTPRLQSVNYVGNINRVTRQNVAATNSSSIIYFLVICRRQENKHLHFNNRKLVAIHLLWIYGILFGSDADHTGIRLQFNSTQYPGDILRDFLESRKRIRFRKYWMIS